MKLSAAILTPVCLSFLYQSCFFELIISSRCLGYIVVQSLSPVQLFAIPWTAAHQSSLTFTVSWSLLKLISIELMIPSNHLILCCSLLLSPSIFPSIRVFSKELALCIRCPKDWSLSFNISPFNVYAGLIFLLGLIWFDLFAVQETLKSLL